VTARWLPPRAPPPMLWRPRFELICETLPRSTLPSPDGLFGRRSTLAPGFGLPEGRLTPPCFLRLPCLAPAFGLLAFAPAPAPGRLAACLFWSPRALFRM